MQRPPRDNRHCDATRTIRGAMDGAAGRRRVAPAAEGCDDGESSRRKRGRRRVGARRPVLSGDASGPAAVALRAATAGPAAGEEAPDARAKAGQAVSETEVKDAAGDVAA